MATEELFRDDSYLRECSATVTAVTDSGLVLDRTVFYPMGGGQPGDRGWLELDDGVRIAVTDTRKGDTPGDIIHICEEPPDAALVGRTVSASIDWERRYRCMRVHSMLHLLGSVVRAGVTGGALIIIGEDYGEGSSIIQERTHAFAMKSSMCLLDPRPELPTIVNLVGRYYEPKQGTIRIAGQDYLGYSRS